MTLTLEVDLPNDLARFRLPQAVADRLQTLVDRQDSGQPLSAQERDEAEGLVDLAEFLTLLRLRAERMIAMSDISPSLHEEVVLRAGNRCEYCRLSQLGQEGSFCDYERNKGRTEEPQIVRADSLLAFRAGKNRFCRRVRQSRIRCIVFSATIKNPHAKTPRRKNG